MREMRNERKKRGWSMEYVGEHTGLTKQAVQLIETGKVAPSYQSLTALENLFEMNHRDLFREVDESA